MSKDWANEWWIKRYTSEGPEDLLLSWQARALWDRLLIKCSRAGWIRINPGERRLRLLAVTVAIPPDVVEPALEELIEDGRVHERSQGFFLPNFEEAQKARKSGSQRMRELRARKAEQELLRNVTGGDETSQNVAEREERVSFRDRRVADAAPVERGRKQPVVAVLEKESDPIFLPTTTTPQPPKLNLKQAHFIRLWDEERAATGMPSEHRFLTQEIADGMQAIIDCAERKNPDQAPEVLRRLIWGLVHDKNFNHKGLSTLVKPRVWRARLDNAFNSLALDAEQERRERRKRDY